jgi:hypothetical protein
MTTDQSAQTSTTGINGVPMSQQVFNSIINKRKQISLSEFRDQQTRLMIQGKGTFITAAEQRLKTPGQKAYFDKYIYNTNGINMDVLGTVDFKRKFTKALQLESAGDAEGASALYRELLNDCQISFNVIANANTRQFNNGDIVKAVIAEVDGRNGKTLGLDKVTYEPPVTAVSKAINLSSLLLVEEPTAPATENIINPEFATA